MQPFLSLLALALAICTTATNIHGGHSHFAKHYVAARRVAPRQVPSYTSPTAPQQTGTFLTWNPAVSSNCTATLSPGILYCVGDPTARPSPLPTPPPSDNPHGPQPQHAGTAADCAAFWLVGGSDTCAVLAEAHGSDCSGLVSGYFICVASESEGPVSSAASSSAAPSSSVASSSTTSTPPTIWPTPTPTQAGMAASFSHFYLVEAGDKCWDISVAAGISLGTLYALNPGVGAECIDLQAGYFICLATAAAHPTPTTITAGPPRYYIVRGGDSCWDIAVALGVSLGTFLARNPALGDECGGL
ncbi:hypothetical protein B0T24DRAFT_718648 [Lasiosphaeria ovina]|uniref:LysM domain-containing protein n=1 Tax=Lasiosphaeria ovina TaxID=92902 RepID=A0AAE0NAM3_9PEZI|nr:hypothetical protein B0T24DRAFT_718648 [Lasiosphaeria ovina]